MIKFRCTQCNKLLGGEDKDAGKFVKCPKCKEKTRIPKPGEAPVTKVEKLEVVDEEEFEIVKDLEVIEEPEELDLAAFEAEEERPRKKARKPIDEEDEDRPRRKPRR